MQTNKTFNKNTKNNIKRASNYNKKECNYCKKKGHLEENCFKKEQNIKSSNNTNSINNSLESNKEKSILSTTKSISNSNNKVIDFILDSGATIHTCYIKELFTSIKPTNTSIKWGNTNNTILAEGIGEIALNFTSTNSEVILTNVLYVPELGVNLMSLSLITNKDYKLSFNKDNCSIYTPSNTLLCKGEYKEGVTVFKAISSKNITTIYNKPIGILNTIENDKIIEIEDNNLLEENATSNSNESIIKSSSKSVKEEELVVNNNTLELQHNRLRHINNKTIKALLSNTKGVKLNLNIDNKSNSKITIDNCTTCIQAKLTKRVNKEATSKVNNYLDLIYIDIGGLITPSTFRGYKYYITFRDSATKYLEVELLKSRKNIVEVIENTITRLELEVHNNSSPNSNYKVKALQLDNEFKSINLDKLFKLKGIIIRYSPPYTLEQNGAAEIINRVLLNKVRALLINLNLPKYLQGEAILAATYLYNRTPNSSINFNTPYYLKYKEIPNLDNIRIWGSLTYYKNPISLIKKLDVKATPYYLIGFIGSNIYKLYNINSNKVINARDCKIIEGYYY